MANEVLFKKGLYANYAALASKDAGTLYFCTDTKQIFMGEDAYTPIVLTGSGAPSAAQAIGTIYADITNKEFYVRATVDGSAAWVKISNESEVQTLIQEVETIQSYIPEGTNGTNNTLVNETMLSDAIADLEGVMHFVGVAPHSEGNTDAQDIAAYMTSLSHTPEAGDVVVCAGSSKEYIYANDAWREIGDEGMYVKKSTEIAGVAIQDGISAAALKSALDVTKVEASQTNGNIKIDGVETPVYQVPAGSLYVSQAEKDAWNAKSTVAVDGTTNEISIDGTATGKYAVTSAEKAAWDAKQDALVFNTEYNAATNKAATMADITSAVNDVEVAINSTNGEVTVGGQAVAGDYKYVVTAAEKAAWNGKQDALNFITAYDATTNKVATAADIEALGHIDGTVSSSNKLATQETVNNAITAAALTWGTF